MKKIKVLIVDDSAVVRQVVQAILEREPDVEVIGAASDPIFAIERMNKQWPDVIVLDIEMPRMDGITFLKKIMAEHPTPVVICSTLAEKGAATTMQALEAGAVEIITKPQIGLKRFLEDSSHDTGARAVQAAAGIRPMRQAKPHSSRRTIARAEGGAQAQCRRHPGRTRQPCHGTDHRTHRCHRHLDRRHPGAGGDTDCTAARSAPASSSCSTCRRNLPPRLPSGSTSFARSKCARRRTMTA